MKILQVVDKVGSAIDQIGGDIARYSPHLQFVRLPIHPKRPERGLLTEFERESMDADVIDFQYYKTALALIQKYPEVLEKPTVLTHHNPYAIETRDWSEFRQVVVLNQAQYKKYPRATLIPHTVDIWQWPWNNEYKETNTVGMVAARIEGKKGILPVAQACKKLGLKLVVAGRVSDENYYQQCVEEGVEFHLDISQEALLELYKEMTLLVTNSVDNFESGPLPVLEAMAVGVPVMARPIGIVPEIFDDDNLFVRPGSVDDVADIVRTLEMIFKEQGRRILMREKAWQTVKNRTRLRTARRFGKVYREALYGTPLVSIVIATFNRLGNVQKILEALTKSTYKNIEVILADDGSSDGTEAWTNANRFFYKFPIKHVNTNEPDKYGLAKARNMGIVETEGEYLLIMDDRYAPEPNAIEEFLNTIKGPKQILLGAKGDSVTMVENFAFCRKNELVHAGMFNERCIWYGCISQEFRNRLKSQGWTWQECPKARSTVLEKTKNRYKRKEDIIRSKELMFKMGME